ncbi:MAG TPA: 4Fe-4S dicluster domain-containing protein [bacterium]|uniref:Ferredoxin n=1 Tax=candidate division TA06 bacterium ADurb.Bin417 TaxID=1852828 RepID=A0A1V5MKD3_UNCT6|nr:MAG: ferredoxin [candidate division TA06 bacterium ADurb.Bin417]HNQ34881.1 4Fe-4S dicluster domain-containing protein [bacterium]HNS48492.1 4Fe-4S dicluster domain-containing protein [bacterium]
MAKRKVIRIDDKKCTGCGLCIPNCAEGALRIIDGKARLVSDLFCDGLGACLGHCPEGAISIEEREAEAYDEKRVMEHVVSQGENVIRAHLEHLEAHGQDDFLEQAREFLREKGIRLSGPAGKRSGPPPSGCPGMRTLDLGKKAGRKISARGAESRLSNWPVQLMLVPPSAPFLKGADLLVAADCVPFACADFHDEYLAGRVLLVGCPKLDDRDFYREKLTLIFKENRIASVTCLHMEVPCCSGLVRLIEEAISASGQAIPFREITIGIKGGRPV